MSHPFTWIKDELSKKVFIGFAVLATIMWVILAYYGEPLKNNSAPAGIISYEFAWNAENVSEIFDEWGPGGKYLASFHLGLDYLFLAIYAFAIGLGCVLVAKNFQSRSSLLFKIGSAAAWLQIAAALLDALENGMLISLIIGEIKLSYIQIAGISASVKFAFVVFGLLYILIGLVIHGLRKAAA